jgi:hypothetical protein
LSGIQSWLNSRYCRREGSPAVRKPHSDARSMTALQIETGFTLWSTASRRTGQASMIILMVEICHGFVYWLIARGRILRGEFTEIESGKRNVRPQLKQSRPLYYRRFLSSIAMGHTGMIP